ncbi:peptidylprolyl isomerase [Sphingobacterium sp. DK4209]|uniref:peptidylprolyl isomerase n=1 Tax=Sphingobacterium zhuxiongii TaxID=2662364 RepID=A0A5Q0Q533_9SPHI|nr:MULTISPECIES: peptidylprolyl isomerase [unclassified Sphingobacterium]MVZ66372.1 peptidylprolyl isomerase [Sphingobacterium sp. DK4209]QGA25147.1 peptidylprolyl isomerase [Sphingobacterium sp. dk4302]
MKKLILSISFLLAFVMLQAQTPKHYYVKITTPKGESVLQLNNETRKHRDNFVKLVKEGYYDSLLFHRVIHNFMIQGGDPDSRFAGSRQELGNGGPTYRIPAEISPSIIHKKGAIGAARDNNPAKESSGSQFYLVQGRVFTQAALDSLEQFRLKGVKLTPLQRETYSTIGGTPHLDGNYTVFGELVKGLEMVDAIAAVKTDDNDRPYNDERFSMRLLTRSEARDLERELQGLGPKKGLSKLFDSMKSKEYKLP